MDTIKNGGNQKQVQLKIESVKIHPIKNGFNYKYLHKKQIQFKCIQLKIDSIKNGRN